MAKSLKVSYFLWIFFGCFGGHHLYLGRDAQAFLWFATLGGGLIGFVIDGCKLPSYVAQANLSPTYFKGWESKRGLKVLEWQLLRWLGAYAVSMYFETVAVLGLDPLIDQTWVLFIIKSVARAVGVYLCFSIGLKRTSMRWCLVGSLVGESVLRSLSFFPTGLLYGARGPVVLLFLQLPFVTTAAAAFWKQKYRIELSRQRHICTRFLLLSLACTCWTLLLSSALYHHLDVPTVEDPTKTRKLRIVLQDVFHSESFTALKEVASEFVASVSSDGILVAKNKAVVKIAALLPEGPSKVEEMANEAIPLFPRKLWPFLFVA